MNDYINEFDVAQSSDWVPLKARIKVIGVGGGGCNAVNYMYSQKVEGCSFVVCNTDQQALDESPVPVKLHLGQNALGAGTDPAKGRNAALEAADEIKKVVLDDDTIMLFITAGMGGGTGTGAAPIIAKMAKDKGILTIGVVTIPFENEGIEAMGRAIDGIHELIKNVDSLLIINNEKLYSFFGQTLMHEAFPKADEVLATAVRGVTEVMSKPGYINIDFEDIKRMMKNSGMSLMGTGTGSGENRLADAVREALESPLLNDFDLRTAKYLMLNVTGGKNEKGLTMEDFSRINQLVNEYTGDVKKFKTGIVWDDDPEIGDKVKITVIATGFKVNDLSRISHADDGNIITIDEDYKATVCHAAVKDGEIEIGEGIKMIGYNSSDNVRRFHFSEDNKPVLVTEYGQNISDLERIPAIKRLARSDGQSRHGDNDA